uniref:Protein kinase domain-containing protein n=1 Tax=Hemiselmis andersenii TaxID=464988 RepID=A0A7S1DII3_HEMAN|mmetsp:Transcript_1580/g.3825  ORF Transcript_1580/g.3825 Transcript_1580/m.3825 type:complete len:303 (+) Transcript_1580:218-1126(+)
MSGHLMFGRGGAAFEISSALVDTTALSVVKRDGVKLINQYEVIKDLGRGSFGKVKLVRHTDTGELFAMKVMNKNVLRKKRMGTRNLLMDVEHEIKVMKLLDHPNIIKMYEVIDSHEHHKLYLRLEYMEGGQCMDSKSDSQALSEATARKYFRDLIAGVEYMHSVGVIHRDIKPENLLLDKNGTVKLADFGTGQIVEGTHMINKSSGTPAFAAPEACVEGAFSGFAADVWACGVSLYMYLHGKCPFMSPNLVAIFQMIRENEPVYSPTLSPEARDLLEKLLDKDPATRITISGIMSHQWMAEQ